MQRLENSDKYVNINPIVSIIILNVNSVNIYQLKDRNPCSGLKNKQLTQI